MERFDAETHLAVIRHLMERASTYRRALGPSMLVAGLIGVAAAALGRARAISEVRPFLLLWGGAAAVSLLQAFWMSRREALRAGEPVFSAPARHVARACLPGFLAGALALGLAWAWPGRPQFLVWSLACGWAVLYGCALHAAGAFIPRGLRGFAWVMIAGGGALAAWLVRGGGLPPVEQAHLAMGVLFGASHIAYGAVRVAADRARHAP